MAEITWHGATIAWARVADLGDFTEADLAAMGERQLARHRQLSGARAAGFLAGRALIRTLVVGLGGGDDVPLDSSCAGCGEDHAAPRTPGFVLSVSHAEDLVAVAVSRGSAPLGVDLERNSAEDRVAELGPMFPAGSAPDLAGWTRIEAAVKADGRGVEIDPNTVRLEPARSVPPAAGPLVWSAVLPGRRSPLQVATLPGPDGHTLSVARG